jgi:hypothetical protein
VAFYFWWAHQDLNLGPKDSGLYSFHCSLDFAFTVACALGGCRQVSTPSRKFLPKLGSALAYAWLHLAFADFDTIPCTVSTRKAHLKNMSPLL